MLRGSGAPQYAHRAVNRESGDGAIRDVEMRDCNISGALSDICNGGQRRWFRSSLVAPDLVTGEANVFTFLVLKRGVPDIGRWFHSNYTRQSTDIVHIALRALISLG
jgi:hypothetical protein